MAYFLYDPNNYYNSMQSFNFPPEPYFLPAFGPISSFRPLLQNYQSPQNFQSLYSTNTWYGSEVKITETREVSSEPLKEKSQPRARKSIQQKNQNRNRNVQKQLESAKKNSQSNLVNQFLSYFSSFNNSSAMIIGGLKKMSLKSKLVENKDFQETTVFFCKLISIINSRRERKYVNKSFIQNYFTVEKLQKYMPDILEKVQKFQFLTKQEFCQLFRRCCFNFFRTISVSSVTSSAKLNQISRPEHIKRRRHIQEALERK